jgi:hypothetical protein
VLADVLDWREEDVQLDLVTERPPFWLVATFPVTGGILLWLVVTILSKGVRLGCLVEMQISVA